MKTIVTVTGMMCHKCEGHVNEAVKANFDIQSVTSDHEKNETVIESSKALDEGLLKNVIEEEGYTVEKITVQA